MLSDDLWQEVDDLFAKLLDLPPGDRSAYLDEHCHDSQIRQQVERLLVAAESAEGLSAGGALKGPLAEEAVGDGTTVEEPPPLAVDTQVGSYTVRGLLGVGGMGQVYRAWDPTLGREVALKLLPAGVAHDLTRLQRFRREAKLLAALNHPNIASIYGLEQYEDKPFLVLELIEGPTLAERLARGPLPLGKAVEIALQLTRALEAAHAQGIVHRDLKPSNVKLENEDRVRVLDFGIAKATEVQDDPTAPRKTATTRTGMILGTASYMSPEQARGLEVDRRADIWAFGCLLFEMLTGRRAFQGDTPSDILASVLREEPHWDQLPAAVPDSLRRLLKRCLHKDTRTRLQAIGDARIEISEWLDALPETAYEGSSHSVGRRFLARLTPWAVSGVAVAIALVAGFAAVDRERHGPPLWLRVDPPEGSEFVSDYARSAAIAPDGTSLVYVAADDRGRQLYWHKLDELDARALPGTEGAAQPFFSPRGLEVAFFSDLKLKHVDLESGVVQTVAEVGGNLRGGDWDEDGSFVIAPSQTAGLYRVQPDGVIEPLTELDAEGGERSHRWPQILADRSVLYTVHFEGTSFDEARLAIARSDGSRPKVVLESAAHGRLLDNGALAFVRGGRLYTVPFDRRRLRAEGEPRLMIEGVAYDARNGGSQFAVSTNGTLLYRPGAPLTFENMPIWLDRSGRKKALLDTPRIYSEPHVAPQGDRLALRIGTPTEATVWTLDLDSQTLSQLTFGPSHRPLWSRRGDSLVFAAPSEGADSPLNLYLLPAEGGQPRRLTDSPNRQEPNSWSIDGRMLVYQERDPESGWDLWALEVDAQTLEPVAAPRPLLKTPFNETHAAFSPDGRFLAYQSDELDAVVQIYARNFPALESKWQLSTGGARFAVWNPTGKSLFYWNTSDRKLVEVALETNGETLAVKGRTDLFRAGQGIWPAGVSGGSLSDPASSGYDVHPDGERFIVFEPLPRPEVPDINRLILVVNWFEVSNESP